MIDRIEAPMCGYMWEVIPILKLPPYFCKGRNPGMSEWGESTQNQINCIALWVAPGNWEWNLIWGNLNYALKLSEIILIRSQVLAGYVCKKLIYHKHRLRSSVMYWSKRAIHNNLMEYQNPQMRERENVHMRFTLLSNLFFFKAIRTKVRISV